MPWFVPTRTHLHIVLRSPYFDDPKAVISCLSAVKARPIPIIVSFVFDIQQPRHAYVAIRVGNLTAYVDDVAAVEPGCFRSFLHVVYVELPVVPCIMLKFVVVAGSSAYVSMVIIPTTL